MYIYDKIIKKKTREAERGTDQTVRISHKKSAHSRDVTPEDCLPFTNSASTQLSSVILTFSLSFSLSSSLALPPPPPSSLSRSACCVFNKLHFTLTVLTHSRTRARALAFLLISQFWLGFVSFRFVGLV
uniref:Uncharacterized protein n=1 Tax=Octopus bimaculoides TaxID=37653 RepID=A0A0L8H9C2_OCTBM